MRRLLLSLCLAGLVAAQPQQQPRARFGGPGGWGGPMSERRLTMQLNLDAVQQNRVHTVIEEGRVQRQGLDQKESDLRAQLAAAIKAGNEGNIDRLSQDLAAIHQQRTAIEAKSMSRIYASLNATQQAQFEREVNRSMGIRPARGPRPGSPGAQPRQPRQPQQQ